MNRNSRSKSLILASISGLACMAFASPGIAADGKVDGRTAPMYQDNNLIAPQVNAPAKKKDTRWYRTDPRHEENNHEYDYLGQSSHFTNPASASLLVDMGAGDRVDAACAHSLKKELIRYGLIIDNEGPTDLTIALRGTTLLTEVEAVEPDRVDEILGTVEESDEPEYLDESTELSYQYAVYKNGANPDVLTKGGAYEKSKSVPEVCKDIADDITDEIHTTLARNKTFW